MAFSCETTASEGELILHQTLSEAVRVSLADAMKKRSTLRSVIDKQMSRRIHPNPDEASTCAIPAIPKSFRKVVD